MNNEEIIDIEKNYFSSIHSNFSKLINKLIKNDNLDANTLKKIIILNKKFNELKYNINKVRIFNSIFSYYFNIFF